MRVTSDLWVSALVRRVFSSGGFAAVERRGAAEAGAIFVIVRDRMGGQALYGPAAQALYGEARPEERQFTELVRATDEETIPARLARECRFDPDIWVVELEPGSIGLEELLPVTKPDG